MKSACDCALNATPCAGLGCGGRGHLERGLSANDVLRENTYGAGQQSVVYVDGWFYLMFTDTTGRASHPNGAGQYVLRSRDPLFGKGVEALGEKGMAPVSGTNQPRTRSVVEAFSADWMWIDAASAFAIAHSTDNGTTITFWNAGLSKSAVESTDSV